MSYAYDQKKIDALASELIEPQRLADGGPPRSRIGKAAAAVRRSIGDEPLEGAPTRANVPNIGEVRLGKNREAEEAARRASEISGVPYRPTTRYAPLDVDSATRLAREYDLMKHDPNDPLVKMAYEQMIKETNDQYEAMLQAGIEPYYIEAGKDPYRNSPYEALLDVAENRRIGVFPSVEGFGTDPNFNTDGNPLLQETGRIISGRPALANDLFRAVHDYFGHAKPGVGFRAAGEENAYQSHAGMFSPLARRALASETRGQNSWLNYGPYGETNRTAKIEDTRFADQKVGLMPRWASEAGLVINDDRRREFFDNLARNKTGLEGAISEDGKLRLIHYSSRPIERIDPEFYGRGLSRASLAERNRSYDPEFVKRSYYGIPASEKPYVPEFGLGGIRNEVLIEPELIYQAQANPEGLWLRNDPTGSERRIAEAGYTGYYTTDPKLGKVAVIFDPYDVSKSYMIPVGAVGAGAMAMSGEDEPEAMAGGGAIRKAAEAVRQADAGEPLSAINEDYFQNVLDQYGDFQRFGLRVIPRGYEVKIGDTLPVSKDWDDNIDTGVELEGTSAIGLDEGSVDWAIKKLLEAGYDGDQIVLIGGNNKGYGHDEGEVLISNATVIKNFSKPEKLSKGGLVDKLRSAASSVKEAGNVYKAAVGNMLSPFEPREPQLGDPNDYEFPELRLRRPGIVNLAIGMPNMPADMRYLFGAVKDAAIGDEVPDEKWRRFDTATEAQGRYEEDMDTFLRAYTGKSVDELSGPMSAVLGVSEAAAQPGIIPAKVVAGLPWLARYLSHLAEFATPVTVASPGAMLTSAGFNAGIRVLPALTDGDDLEQMNARYSGRELSGEEQAGLDDYLQELLGTKDEMVEPELLAGGGAIRKAAEAIGAANKSTSSRPVDVQVGLNRAKSMVEQSGQRWDDVKQITTPEEYIQFQRRYGLASAVSERDDPTDVFNQGGSMFYDEETGKPVAYAPSSVGRKKPEGMASGGLIYDADAINALAAQLIEPVKLSEGGPPRSRIAKAAAAIRGAAKVAGDALDMSNEARMQRAAEQGFNVDEILYHGTDKSFDNFIPKRGLSGTASYLTPDPDVASAYAMGDVKFKRRGEGANILPTYVRGSILDQQDLTRGQEIDIWKAIEDYELANARPNTLKYEMLTDKKFPSMSESLLDMTDEEYVPDFVQMMEKLAEIKRTEDILGGLGYTGVRGLEELINARNRPGLREYESIAVFDPKNIRSVNARFNPLDIDSSNILSGLGAGAVGLGALASQEEPEEFSGGGKIRRAASAIRGATTPPRGVPDELSVSDEEMMRIARDLGVDIDETIIPSDVPTQPIRRTGYGRSTIRGAGRKTIPGIYDDPRLIVERASAAVAPESEAMQQLFGVTREDLAKVAMEREPVVWSPPGAPARPRGTDYAALVMQPANTQRLVDILDEASESPLRAGMTGWYMLDPAYRRLVELVGEEEAKKLFVDMNTLTGVHSANAAVANELTRGTAMNWLNRENRLSDYVKYGAKAGMEGAPADMATIPGHLAHKTAHIIPALRYLETGELSKEAKTPAYITASNPPEIGTNVNFPVGDAHFVRAIGLSDVRPETKYPSARFASWSMPEAMQLNDWFTSDVARRAGLSGVSAQALLWGALSPTTGVKSKIGAPKLEILADLIMQTAQRLKVSPEEARDMVLLGRAYAGKAAGGLVGYKQQISGEM